MNRRTSNFAISFPVFVAAFIAVVFGDVDTAYAYIGPGAGFAFIGSGFIFILTSVLALVTICAWPFMWLVRRFRRRGISPRARRVVVVGLDGLDPNVAERLMEAGSLPNLKQLSSEGGYRRLRTTLPALSPVAWSTFQTGVNPGAHNIFDFLSRDKRRYIPTLTSTQTIPGKVWELLGKKVPVGKPKVVLTRKSQPFWKLLAKRGIFSTILRVPISYPPEKFSGAILSAMCTPDIRGTQGTFSFYTTHSDVDQKTTGGERRQFKRESGELKAELIGPEIGGGRGPLTIPFVVTPGSGVATLEIQGKSVALELNKLSEWISVSFSAGWRRKIQALVRFCLRECEGDAVSLYVTPLNVDPEKPILPIAAPIYFSSWLAKRIGHFSTLGFAEDTWGRNELAMNDEIFLEQAYKTHAERERMFFEALKRTREGVLACVFDATDRVQHMFWRYIDQRHPSPREDEQRFGRTIDELYENMDAMVGRVRQEMQPEDVLIVLSDHGFSSFRRGINLNKWLLDHGYLKLKPGSRGDQDYLQDVDWSATRAYALGLTGIYINRKGRELHGIVEDSLVKSLKAEIREGLLELRDPLNNDRCIAEVYDSEREYRGVYSKEAPDLIMGFEPGYRVSWDSVTGSFENEIFSDNIKAWSGDHHIDPKLVPGVLFVNREIRKDSPSLLDLAPSILDLFDIRAPKYMEGSAIF